VHLGSFLKSLVLILSLLLYPTGPAVADPDIEANAKGMTLNAMKGRTLVGVTRDSSAVFSVYLGPDGTADFHLSNGTRATATWAQLDSSILCFQGLVKERPKEKVCKRAPANGRGLDWMTIILQTANGKTTYAKENPDEARGSSQMVYSFEGKVEIDQASYVADVGQWAGHLIVGRTLKDKEAWFAFYDSDGGVDFVFASGKRFKGSYTLKADEVCMEFPENPDANGCRKPVTKDGKIRWTSTKDGGASSEIVYMKRLETDGPQDVARLANESAYYTYPSPDRQTVITAPKDSNELLVWNTATGAVIGQISSPKPVDIEFSWTGKTFATVQPNGVEVFDLATGAFIVAIERPANSANFREVAFVSGTEVVVGDERGNLRKFSISDGRLKKAYVFGTAAINNMAFNPKGQILVGDTDGKLAVLDADLVPLPGLSSKAEGAALGLSMDKAGNYALATAKDNTLTLFQIQGPLAPLVTTKKMSTDALWSAEFDASGIQAVVTLGTDVALFTLPSLSLVKRWQASDAKLSRASFAGNSGAVIFANNNGQMRVTAPDLATAKAWKAARANLIGPEMLAYKAHKDSFKRKSALKSLDEALAVVPNGFYESGNCTGYSAARNLLRLDARKTDCERQVVLRKARADFASAIAAKDCDRAEGLIVNSATDRPLVDQCRATALRAKETAAYAAAKAAGDCAGIEALQAKFNEPDAANACTFNKVLTADNARAMYLAAVRLDTAGDTDRAMQLYTEIMTRFSEDDLAIDAANRLTALADLAKMEATQAEQAAEQAKAIKAAEARAAEAEKTAKATAAEAERQRIAREDDARRADAARAAEAAAAAAQPQRNTSCDYVTVGQKFVIEGGGFFGLGDAYYTVIGISREGGIVTARLAGTDITNQFNCSSVN
jgi:hypothetical protein